MIPSLGSYLRMGERQQKADLPRLRCPARGMTSAGATRFLVEEGRTPFAPVGPTRGGSAAAIPSTASGLFSVLGRREGSSASGLRSGTGTPTKRGPRHETVSGPRGADESDTGGGRCRQALVATRTGLSFPPERRRERRTNLRGGRTWFPPGLTARNAEKVSVPTSAVLPLRAAVPSGRSFVLREGLRSPRQTAGQLRNRRRTTDDVGACLKATTSAAANRLRDGSAG
jgi:hypothetical protein